MSKPFSPEFIDFVELHHQNLRVYIRCIGAQAHFVDDLAQEAFLIAWGKWEEWDETRDPLQWVKGIAYKLMVNERRKLARRQRITHDGVVDHLLRLAEDQAKQEEPQRGILQAENARDLGQCLDKLPDHSRELLEMRYQKSMSTGDICERLEWKSDRVRQQLSRLRQKLKACLDEQGGVAWD